MNKINDVYGWATGVSSIRFFVKDSQFYQSSSFGPLNYRSQEKTIIWRWCWEPEKRKGQFELYLTQIWVTPVVVYWRHIA